MSTDDLRLAIGYLRNLARRFENIPECALPMFYHTLTEEGDRAEGAQLNALIGRMEAELP